LYETLILVAPSSSIHDDHVASALAQLYPESNSPSPTITNKGSYYCISWPQFTFELGLSKLPHVIEESKEIADQFAKGLPQQDLIAQCFSRVELVGDDDPEMQYFNDYCYIVEAIEKLGTVFTFDQGSCKFMNL